jgi:16S rRNA (cytosine967-C5)-methyltransferase
MHARALAAKVIAAVARDGRSLSDALPQAIGRLHESAERALLQELCYGTLRDYYRLAALAARFLRKPVKRKDEDIRALTLIGLHQLASMRVAPHAAVSLTVAACDELGKAWAKGLVNAILRGYQRTRSEAEGVGARFITRSATGGMNGAPANEASAEAPQDREARYNHPAWLIDALQADWPERWREILDANDARAPMTLRVNRRKIPRDDYRRELAERGIESSAAPYAPDALILAAPIDVLQLPAFEQGHVSVQDAGAQLAAPLLEAQNGERILDACAAPGGKSAHILESVPGTVELHALDVDAQRLERVHATLRRLGLSARCIAGDAGAPAQWWDGVPYDRVLLDAPCSATGVIRRHPDIKLLRRAADVDALAARQSQLLRALWPLLKPGGQFVYATCSVLKRENELPLIEFLEQHDDARERVIDAEWGRACRVGRQILPGEAAMDGFYYARIIKS